MPLSLIIGSGLARDDSMLANLLVCALGCCLVNQVGPIGITGIFMIQRSAGELAPIETGRLLRCVVAETSGNHFTAIGSAEVETVGRSLLAQMLLLKFHDLHKGFVHCTQHLTDWILLLPGILCAMFGQIGNVKSCGVLRVRAAQDIAIGVKAE